MQAMHYYNRSTATNSGGGGVPGMPTLSADYRQTVPPSYHGYTMSPTPDAFHHQHHQRQQTASPIQQTPIHPVPSPSPSPLTHSRAPSSGYIAHQLHNHHHQHQLPQQSPMHRACANAASRPPSAFDRDQRYASLAPGAAYGYQQHQQHQHQQHNHPHHHIGHTVTQRTYGTDSASLSPNPVAAARHPQSAYLLQQQQQQRQHLSSAESYGAGSNQYHTNGVDGAFGQQMHQSAAHAYDTSGNDGGHDGSNMMYLHNHHQHHQQRRQHHPPPNSHMYPNSNAFERGPNLEQPMHHRDIPTQSNDTAVMPRRVGGGGDGGEGGENGPEYPSGGASSYAHSSTLLAPPQPPPTSSHSHHFHHQQQQQHRDSQPSQFYAQHPTTDGGPHMPCMTPAVTAAATITPTSTLETTAAVPPSVARELYDGADETVTVQQRHSSTSFPIQSPPPTEPPPPPPPPLPLHAIDATPASLQTVDAIAVRSGHANATAEGHIVAGGGGNGSLSAPSDDGGEQPQQQQRDFERLALRAATDSNGVREHPHEGGAIGGAFPIMSSRERIDGDGNGMCAADASGSGKAAAAAAKHDGSIAARSVEVTSNYPTPPPSTMPPFHQHATEHHQHHHHHLHQQQQHPHPQHHDAHIETKYRRTHPGGREKNLSKMAAMNRKLESDTFYGSAPPMFEMERAWNASQTHHTHHQAYRHMTNRSYMMDSAMYYHQYQHHPYHHPHHYYGHPNLHARYAAAGSAYMRSHMQMHPHMQHAPWTQMGGRGQHDWGTGNHIGPGMAAGSAYAAAAFRRQQQLQPTIRQAASPAPADTTATARKPQHSRLGRPPARELYSRPNSGVFESDVIPNKKKRKPKVTDADKEQQLPRTQIEAKSVTPLPGFLQAFGSTEIGRFSEVFFNAPDSPTVDAQLQQPFAFGIDFEPDTLSPQLPFGIEMGDSLEASSFYVPSGSSSVHSMNAESYTSTGSPASSGGYFGEARGVEY